jgi:hypothetical protein
MEEIKLKKLKSHNTIWHPDSRLVFRSNKERVVIGKLSEDGENIDPLTKEMIEQSEKIGFEYDQTLINDDEIESSTFSVHEETTEIPEFTLDNSEHDSKSFLPTEEKIEVILRDINQSVSKLRETYKLAQNDDSELREKYKQSQKDLSELQTKFDTMKKLFA